MKSWSPLVLAPVLALSLACATQPRPNLPADDEGRAAAVIEREKQLTNALAQGRQAALQTLLADDFRCAVEGHSWFTIDREPVPRWSACTGFGHDEPEGEKPYWLHAFNNSAPRTASIDEIAVALDDQGRALVVSMQTYRNWLPYSGLTPRRSKVTDTWIVKDGQWRLQRRISRPLR